MPPMTWFFAILIVLVMGVIAVVASGRGGSMAEVYDDRPDSRVPADRPLTSTDIRRVRFSTAFRGYRMSEVDALLDRVAAELEPPSAPGAAPSAPDAPPEGSAAQPPASPGPRPDPTRPEER
jgi:DivIVA domain-containing protein